MGSDSDKNPIHRFMNRTVEKEASRNGTGSGMHHSTYYHSYYEGYTEVRTENAKGRYKITRVYTSPWKARNLSPKSEKMLKALYVFLYIAAVLIFFCSLHMENALSNFSLLVAAFSMVSTIILLFLLPAMINYVVSPSKMTYGEYHFGPVKLKLYTLCSFIGMLLTLLSKVICIVANPVGALGGEYISIAMLAVSAAMIFSMNRIEKGMEYIEIDNDTTPEGELHPID